MADKIPLQSKLINTWVTWSLIKLYLAHVPVDTEPYSEMISHSPSPASNLLNIQIFFALILQRTYRLDFTLISLLWKKPALVNFTQTSITHLTSSASNGTVTAKHGISRKISSWLLSWTTKDILNKYLKLSGQIALTNFLTQNE